MADDHAIFEFGIARTVIAAIDVLPVHANRSGGSCTIEAGAIRLGFAYVDGIGESGIERILQAREPALYRDLADFCRQTRLPRRIVENLILAGAMDDWNRDRRRLIWELGRLRYREEELPLVLPDDSIQLDPMDYAEELTAEYGVTGVSANGPSPSLTFEGARAPARESRSASKITWAFWEATVSRFSQESGQIWIRPSPTSCPMTGPWPPTHSPPPVARGKTSLGRNTPSCAASAFAVLTCRLSVL